MEGHAAAPGAGTILNALATGVGAAFAIDVETRATVSLDSAADGVAGEVAGAPDADTRLVERCVSLVVEQVGDGEGGLVRTESDVPMAAGLKSSSAAANATVLATLSALDVAVGVDGDVSYADACRLGVAAARDVGVTVTGAFDDASASMLGGVTVTNNAADELLAHDPDGWSQDVLVWTPPERAYSADADVDRCGNVALMADLVARLALDGRYAEAMSVNGLAFSAALGFSTEPAIEAMPHAAGVSLSGTGPSVVAVGSSDGLDRVADVWNAREGELISTTTRHTGARIR
ncbi:shikimate kinase [Haloferacaceae archaeon DSL9]